MTRHTLRYYQQDAVKATIASWKRAEVPYSSVFTGLGKSLIMADLTDRVINQGGRIIQIVPRLELVEQNFNEAKNYVKKPDVLGRCCSAIDRFENKSQAVIAQYSSFLSRRAISGSFNVCLIDECHRVAPEHDSQYRKILRSLLRINPKMLIAGFTGTPYRLDQGELHLPCQKNDTPVFTHKVYDTAIDVGLNRLISEGYLAEIKICNTHQSIDLTGISKASNGDYITSQVGKKFELIADDAVEEMRRGFIDENIQTAIIFTSNLTNAAHILARWGDNSTMRIVSGDTAKKHERKQAIDWIKNGTGKRYIVCVDILAEGFDYKALEAVVLMRATVSPGLLVQMAGRIIRPHGEKIGKIWDFGSNFQRLGTLDAINVPKNKKKSGDKPQKLCTNCDTLNDISAKHCVSCGWVFVVSDDGNYSLKSKAEILRSKWQTIEIGHITYGLKTAKNGRDMVKIDYADEFLTPVVTQYLCLDHDGTAGLIAQRTLLQLFKNKKDLYALNAAGGLNSADVYELLETSYSDYFKPIKAIVIGSQDNNQKFMEVKHRIFG